jgi:glycosyltransferase involved in cell wall biosynthesis
VSRLVYLCPDRGIDPAKHNGAAAHFRMVVGAMRELGHEVLVVSASRMAPAGSVRNETLPTPAHVERLLAESDTVRAPGGHGGDRSRQRMAHAIAHLLGNVVVEATLRRVLPPYRPDAVIELLSPFGFAGAYTSAALGVRHLLYVHAPLAWEGRVFRSQPLFDAAEMLEERALAAATRIAVNSREMGEIVTGMSIDPARVVVVPNGVDPSLFAPSGQDHRDRLPPGAIVVGFSGSLKAWHGVEVLLDAFARTAPADRRLHLLVVGDGPMRRAVREATTRLADRVTSTGAIPLEEVPAWVRTMDVAVSPYTALERFYFSPLKTLEYMAAGRATVSSAIGQLGELIEHGRTGLLVPPGDAAALAEAILRLAGDAALRTRLGGAAAVAAQRHRWTDRIAELVDAAMSQPPEAFPGTHRQVALAAEVAS